MSDEQKVVRRTKKTYHLTLGKPKTSPLIFGKRKTIKRMEAQF